MTRNVKTLGLALVAVFAISAMAASAAQAEGEGAPDFAAAEYPATINATFDEGKQVFTSGPLGGKVRCEKVGGEGTLSKQSNELTSENIEFKGNCAALGVFPVTVDTNGCAFKFTVEKTNTATTSEGSVHLECPDSKGITITIFAFDNTAHNNLIETAHIKGGQTFQGITFHNIETGDGTEHVTVEANVENEIHAVYEGSITNETSTTDSYEGSFIASGENSKGEAIDTTITDT